MEKYQDFEYKEKGQDFYFQRTQEGGFICWNCGKTFMRILKHLQLKERCRGNMEMDQFSMKLREYKLMEIRKDQNSRNKKSINKKREQLGDASVKNDQNK